MTTTLPAPHAFILPGRRTRVSFGHVARIVCRRAERGTLLHEQENGKEIIICYLNRLSDYLFVLCQKMAL